METSRADGVKAPPHDGTPRSHHIIINSLGHADDGDGVVVAFQVFRDLGRLRVRVVSPNGVEDRDLVHHQLLGRAV